MPIGDAARVHRYCRGDVAIAREDGETQVRFRVGDIRNGLGMDHYDDAITICQVLDTQKFREQARVEFLGKSGPQQGWDTVYRFRVL